MKIDITDILLGKTDIININEVLELETNELVNKDIEEFKDFKVSGTINRLDDNIYNLNLTVDGILILLDSLTLEKIEYPINIEIDENINIKEFDINLENTIDISNILWENIVLEIPNRVVKDETHKEIQGNGWSLNNIYTEGNELESLKSILESEEKE